MITKWDISCGEESDVSESWQNMHSAEGSYKCTADPAVTTVDYPAGMVMIDVFLEAECFPVAAVDLETHDDVLSSSLES